MWIIFGIRASFMLNWGNITWDDERQSYVLAVYYLIFQKRLFFPMHLTLR